MLGKGGALFIGWSIDAVGPFLQDNYENCYFFVAVDPFSKWVETCPHHTARGPPSSYMMRWLPTGASHATSGQTIAPSLQAALHSSIKG